MLQKYNKWTILRLFFENPIPQGGFQLRELSRCANLAPKSVKNYLEELLKESLIIVKPHRVSGYARYYANRDNTQFKLLKKFNTILLLTESKLLEKLISTFLPETIILFGSASKGEDTIESDLDLFLLCAKKDFELEPYEKEFKRKINLFFSTDFHKISKELKNNIINGTILYGYLKVF